ncbi:hypothetical protein PMAYCL1PPCAC_18911, partial [Pristionchus mayeri]
PSLFVLLFSTERLFILLVERRDFFFSSIFTFFFDVSLSMLFDWLSLLFFSSLSSSFLHSSSPHLALLLLLDSHSTLQTALRLILQIDSSHRLEAGCSTQLLHDVVLHRTPSNLLQSLLRIEFAEILDLLLLVSFLLSEGCIVLQVLKEVVGHLSHLDDRVHTRSVETLLALQSESIHPRLRMQLGQHGLLSIRDLVLTHEGVVLLSQSMDDGHCTCTALMSDARCLLTDGIEGTETHELGSLHQPECLENDLSLHRLNGIDNDGDSSLVQSLEGLLSVLIH